jgi:type IV pilus assembly protein PilO
MNMQELTLENIGSWPMWAKGIVLSVVCILLIGCFYFFDIKPQELKVSQLRLENEDLRATYELKYEQSVNLPEYQAQIQKINQLINHKLEQLPKEIDLPNLIEDISKMGIAAGLEFTSIKPLAEVDKEFYTELPIQIEVSGNYHQFGQFVSNLASLQRIVTLDDFKIQVENMDNSQQVTEKKVVDGNHLTMSLVAKTYKQTRAFKNKQAVAYLDEGES